MVILLPIIFIIIMVIFLLLFLSINKRQEETMNKMSSNSDRENTNILKNESSANSKEKGMKREDVFKFMTFDRITNNMIVQNGGSRYTMAIKCKGINYDLMSEVEQLAVEEGFITFLNTLRYPIQLYVQAQNIDLKDVVKTYRDNVMQINQDYADINKEYNKLVSRFDVDENKLDRVSKERDSITNVYEYANDMISYVEKMSTNKNLLQRSFYVLLSYGTAEIPAVDKFSKDEILEMCFTELNTRCRAILSALSACSVTGNVLTSNELGDLLYTSYNRDDRGLMSVKEALDSDIFRLYSTSEDAIYKQTLALDEYLDMQAKVKALEALRDVIEKGEISTEASEKIDEEEEISMRATKIIKNEDFDNEVKDEVNKKILTDFRDLKKELLEEDKIQKEEFIKNSNIALKELDNIEQVEKPRGVELLEKADEYANEIKKQDEGMVEKNVENPVEINEEDSSNDEEII